MKPSCSVSAWLAHVVDPFYVVLVSLLAAAALPVPSGWVAALWMCSMVTVTFLLRRRSKERANELSRATLLPTRVGERRPIDRVSHNNSDRR